MLFINKYIKESLAYAKYSAKNWEESIAFGGGLLEKEKIITPEYTKAMIDAVHELGPYIVVAPGIALAHAKPGLGVKEIGISVVTLKNSINFGHEFNDPVDILICLAAVDNISHLELLQNLSVKLMNNEFISKLKNSNTSTDIVKTFLE